MRCCSVDHPDEGGDYLAAVRRFLRSKPIGTHIKAFFWDYSSLHQKSASGDRTPEENEAFKRALAVMGDLYASVTGTTVLQSPEIPQCPEEYSKMICLFGLKDGIGEEEIRKALSAAGEVVDVKIGGYPDAVVTFDSTYDVKALSKVVSELCSGNCPFFNSRLYHDRGW